MVILGGSFGSGRRGNFLSTFHLGVGVRDPLDPTSPPQKFKTFCRVGSGYTDTQLNQVRNYIYTYVYEYIYRILNRCTACRFRVCPFISSEQRVYWLAERQSLKPVRKLSLLVTFVPNEIARPDQIADLIKELYILNRCKACRFGVCSFISSEQRVYWLAERQRLKACMYIFA